VTLRERIRAVVDGMWPPSGLPMPTPLPSSTRRTPRSRILQVDLQQIRKALSRLGGCIPAAPIPP
jgi:hypothetical protein